jgi:hypothetical protein
MADTMLQKLLQKWDIDSYQLKILFRMGLKLDFQSIGTRSQQIESKAGKYMFFYTLFAYTMMSLFLCALLFQIQDIYTFFYIVLSFSMTMTSMAVLIEFYSVVIHPDDFEILGHRPISSGTYFAAKLLNLTFYIGLISTSMTILPIGAAIFRVKSMIVMAPVVYLVCLSGGLTAAFFVIYIYAWLMSKIQHEKLQTILGYLQMVFSFVIFFGYSSVGILFQKRIKHGFTFSGIPWLWITPMSWYAGFCDLLYGNVTLITICLSVTAIAVTVVFANLGIRRISQTYAKAVSAQQANINVDLTASERKSWSHQLANFISDPDIRVGFTLVSLYLKRDKKLRMAIFPMFGMIVFYYFYPYLMNRGHTGMMDIFTVSSFDKVTSSLMFFMFVPVFTGSALAIIRYSTEWQASWIYYSAPVNPVRLYAGAYLSVILWILVPMWLVTTVLFSWSMPVLHALAQTLVFFILADYYALSSHLLLPHLPLSAPFVTYGRQARVVITMFLGMFLTIGCLFLEYFLFKYFIGIILFYISLAGVTILLHLWENMRLRHFYAKFEFSEQSS